jgi:tRNA pseudouridine55 synthase
MDGVIILDKPAGCTSRQCVSWLAALTGEKKAGHTGTLDPFATGILPVCFGRATKLVDYIRCAPKTYTASLRWGIGTDTQDITGRISVATDCALIPSIADIQAVFKTFTGQYIQTVPDFSARKIKGRRAYSMAREGIDIPRKMKTVEIYKLSLDAYRYPILEFTVSCSEGTYIRTLGMDISEKLGLSGVLVRLRRIQIGTFSESEAQTMKSIRLADRSGKLHTKIQSVEAGVTNLRRAVISEQAERPFRNGIPVPTTGYKRLPEGLKSGEPVAVFSFNYRFLGIATLADRKNNSETVLKTVKLIDIQQ